MQLIQEAQQQFTKFAKSCAMHVYEQKARQHLIFTCQRAKDVPFFKFACQRSKSVPTFHFYVPTCQRANNVPFFKLACQRAKRRANFSTIFQKKNVSIMIKICKFQGYLGNSRKFIQRNKEFEGQYFDIRLFIPRTPQIFLKKHTLCKMITKLLQEQKYSKTQS